MASLFSSSPTFALSASHSLVLVHKLSCVSPRSLASPAAVFACVLGDISNWFCSVAFFEIKSLTLAVATSSFLCRTATKLLAIDVCCRLESHSLCEHASSLLDQAAALTLAASMLIFFSQAKSNYSSTPSKC